MHLLLSGVFFLTVVAVSIMYPLQMQKSSDYGNILKDLGLIRSDQQVGHIIAGENGGADHPHNYFVVSSESKQLSVPATLLYIDKDQIPRCRQVQ